MAYMSGFVNYKTHAEARAALLSQRITTWVVLNEMSDGTATITFLQRTPVQHGQAEWRGNPNDIEYNKPENCPLCGGELARGKQRYCPSCGTFEPR